jgi:hypothetical protein
MANILSGGSHNSRAWRRHILFPIFVLAVFVAGSLISPPRSQSARATATKKVAGVRAAVKTIAPPPAPVRRTRDEGMGIEGPSMRCGGAECQHNNLVCSQGTIIEAVTGCCARCCWDWDPNNCSSINCCSPN